MNSIKQQIVSDIKAFADDESDVVIEQNGMILFTRGGQDYIIELKEDRLSGRVVVRYNDFDYPFREFLSKQLANIPLLAKKIIEKRKKT